MRHGARRMEHRIARAVSAGGISGGVAGAVAGSAVANKRAERKNTASKENRGNTTSSMGQRAGSKVGAVLDTKNKVKDKANAVKENIKDIDQHTTHEKEIIELRLQDTNGIENFVKNFAKSYYTWSNSKE